MSLTVMILCGRSPRHLYVANRLCRVARPVAIVHEAGRNWTAAKVRRMLKPKNLWNKSWRWLRDRSRYRGNQEAQYFFGDRAPHLDREDLLHLVSDINDPEVVKLADRHRPDVIAVFGTSLIRGPLLERGRLGIVNLHGGLSPEYRGADCTFWALHNGEPGKVGCTIHFIDSGIDSGELIAHVCPEIGAGDDELLLFWRAVRDSADVYADLLLRLERGDRFGQRQPGKGQLYRVKDRKWKHERALACRMAEGLLGSTSLPRRVHWFPRQDVADATDHEATG